MSLKVEQVAAEAEAKALRCKFIAKDAQASVNTQVSNLNDLLAQGITALVATPLDPKALGPGLARAKARGVQIVSTQPGIVGVSNGYPTEPLQGFDHGAYATAQFIAQKMPGARFGTIGFAIPVPNLVYYVQRLAYWGKKFGLKYVGNANEGSQAISDATKAATALTSAHPNIQAIMTFNDLAAEGVAAFVRQTGKKILVSGYNGEVAAIKGVQSGALASTYRIGYENIGKQAVIATYDLLTKQHLPLPRYVLTPGQLVTSENAGNVTGVGG